MNYPKFPKVGDIVLFTPNPGDDTAASNNNPGPVAAIITRVWGPQMVNLKIIPDHGPMQDRSSVGHKSLYPNSDNVSYHWQYGNEADLVATDENIDLMKTSTFQMLSPKSPDFKEHLTLVENFYEGLRTLTKVKHGKWIKIADRVPELGKAVLIKDSEGQEHSYTRFGHGYRSNGKEQGFDNNNALIEWYEED